MMSFLDIPQQFPATAVGNLVDFFEDFGAFVIRVGHTGFVADGGVKFAEKKDGIVVREANGTLAEFHDRLEIAFIHSDDVIELSQVFAGHAAGAVGEREAMRQGILPGA